METTKRGVREDLRRLTDGLSRLVREHVELAKAELREEAKAAALDAAMAAVALPFLLAALLLFDAALALALGTLIGAVWACLLVGLLNLGIGGLLGLTAAMRLHARSPLADTKLELRRDRMLLEQLGQTMQGQRGPLPPPGIRPYPPEARP